MTIEEIKDILRKHIDEDYWTRGGYVDGVWLDIETIINWLERGY